MCGGVQTLRNVSTYKEPTWHFDAQFVNNQGHTKENVHGHGHLLEMKNTAYQCHLYSLQDKRLRWYWYRA